MKKHSSPAAFLNKIHSQLANSPRLAKNNHTQSPALKDVIVEGGIIKTQPSKTNSSLKVATTKSVTADISPSDISNTALPNKDLNHKESILMAKYRQPFIPSANAYSNSASMDKVKNTALIRSSKAAGVLQAHDNIASSNNEQAAEFAANNEQAAESLITSTVDNKSTTPIKSRATFAAGNIGSAPIATTKADPAALAAVISELKKIAFLDAKNFINLSLQEPGAVLKIDENMASAISTLEYKKNDNSDVISFKFKFFDKLSALKLLAEITNKQSSDTLDELNDATCATVQINFTD